MSVIPEILTGPEYVDLTSRTFSIRKKHTITTTTYRNIERKKLSKPENTRVREDTIQTKKEVKKASKKFRRTREMYTSKNRALTAPIAGMIVVASTETLGD
jgi:hypothetical protein